MLVEALVALAILAIAGTIIYQTGAGLLARVDGDLDRSVALTNLHTISVVLQAIGAPAERLLPSEDGLFRYTFSLGPDEERIAGGDGTAFYWASIHAIDISRRNEVAKLALGYDG